MEALVIVLFIVLIILILSIKNSVLERIDRLETKISRLQESLEHRDPPISKTPVRPQAAHPAAPPQDSGVPPLPPTPREMEPFIPKQQSANPSKSTTTAPRAVPTGINIPHTPEPAKPGFFERNPDLEKFIGENLISKIGIAVLVLAIGFFVKYAIDNNWIGPVGRVGIGLICGGILVGLAHVLRNSYKAFSSVLVGGGLAIFYFTIALAYHEYQLFNQIAAFIIMLVITVFAIILSILYDRQELAIIALVGGFVAPFLAGNGQGNYRVLFTYLLILNTGLLAIAYNKAWRLLNILAFLFTSLLFASWMVTLPAGTNTATYQGGFVFASVFYILFFVINLLHNIKENKKFIAWDFGILLGNTGLYFTAGLYLLTMMGLSQYKGLFSVSMGTLNLIASWLLLRNRKVDSNILYLLIGITVTFVSLTAPLQLHGHFITLFWASESVVLFWLCQKSGFRILKIASAILWAAMVISLMMDWASVYANNRIYVAGSAKSQYALTILFNKGFMTGLYCAICCYLLFFLQRRKMSAQLADETGSVSDFALWGKNPVLNAGSIILFATGALEINYQFNYYYPDTQIYIMYLLLYTLAFAFLLTSIAVILKGAVSYLSLSLLLVVCIVLYMLLVPADFNILKDILEGDRYRTHFLAHWTSALLAACILYRLISWQRSGKASIDPTVFTWLMGSVVVIFLSVEIELLVKSCFYSKTYSLENIQQVFYKTGLPILWSICSFLFMWLGMRFKFKPLRILSLVLFSITLLKLFLFDIRNIPVAGKIAAFFCLGVLLLIVSFMYQRLKKIIIEDEEKKTS